MLFAKTSNTGLEAGCATSFFAINSIILFESGISLFSRTDGKDKTQWGLWEYGKIAPRFGGTFPSGGGNPRFLRISTDAAFPSGHYSVVFTHKFH
jgi:hypothetical protein